MTAQFFHRGSVQESRYVEICICTSISNSYDSMHIIDIDNHQYWGGVSRKIITPSQHFMDTLHGADALVLDQYYKIMVIN